MSEELKPCPFCGGKAIIVEGEESAYVQCLDMKMHRALWFDGDNAAADEVREQWNRRGQMEEIIDLIERAKTIIPNHLINWHYTAEQVLSKSKLASKIHEHH